MQDHRESIRRAIAQVNRVLLGKERSVAEVMLAFLANGHVLLEDIPGVGKTTLARAFSRVLDLTYHRVQFTPDVMPSDLTGFSIYRREEERFVYQPGSVFCNLLLADELNRTSPKTQSALLEVMEERQVSVEGVTREVPEPFLVIATENPLGAAGTQSLPEAQIDRFLVSMSLGYPDLESELAMARSVGTGDRVEALTACVSREALLAAQRDIHEVYIKEEVLRYIVDLVAATRSAPQLERGASPRATIALVKLARASAWLDGRSFATPRDVLEQFPYAAAHRVAPAASARARQRGPAELLAALAETVEPPPMGER